MVAAMAMLWNARAFSTVLLANGGVRSSRAAARLGRRGLATMAARRMPAGAAPMKSAELVKEEGDRGEMG